MAKDKKFKSAKAQTPTRGSLWRIGREEETAAIQACVRLDKNVLLEGPVGVGKTHLATAIAMQLGRPLFRIDGDSRYSEQKLAGGFDPTLVLKKGFVRAAFVSGPLVQAMESGGVLLINELNRLPEGVQNILLPAIDERRLEIPKIGTVTAKPGFCVIATQNPKEFVATSHLSEALLDRFEWIFLDYQTEDDEQEMVRRALKTRDLQRAERLARVAVRLVRLTRERPEFKRGGSVRAALSVAVLAEISIEAGVGFDQAIQRAALLALPTRVELSMDAKDGPELEASAQIRKLLKELVDVALGHSNEKKKN